METSNGMNINKTNLLVIGGVLIIVIAGTAQLLSPRSAVSPTASTATSTTEQIVSTTTIPAVSITDVKITQKDPVVHSLSLEKGDIIESWDFVGAYTNNPEFIAKANAEIKRISGLVGKGTYTDTSIYVGIANQYELIGDGKKQYDFLIQAVREGGTTSGLPWHNLGVLMERLGALQTARVAYEKATLVQPQFKFYHYAYLEFITKKMKDDVVDIEKAFTAANKYFSTDADVIQLRAEWDES